MATRLLVLVIIWCKTIWEGSRCPNAFSTTLRFLCMLNQTWKMRLQHFSLCVSGFLVSLGWGNRVITSASIPCHCKLKLFDLYVMEPLVSVVHICEFAGESGQGYQSTGKASCASVVVLLGFPFWLRQLTAYFGPFGLVNFWLDHLFLAYCGFGHLFLGHLFLGHLLLGHLLLGYLLLGLLFLSHLFLCHLLLGCCGFGHVLSWPFLF